MAVLRDFFSGFAAQYVHQVPRTEAHTALAVDAVNRGQQHLRRFAGVPHRGWLQAVVAIAAGCAVLPEVSQQAHTAAVAGFGQAQQRVELAAQHSLEFFGRRALVDHAPLVDHVLQAVAHPGVSRQTVAPGTARFLVIALDVFGHVQMRDKAHVGLVDTHAEGNRGHHHHAVFSQEAVLVVLPHGSVQTGVVWQCTDTGLGQHIGNVLHLFARLAIHHACLLRVFALDEAQQLRGAVGLFHDAVADVGAVKTADEGAGVFKLQSFDDVGAGDGVCGGGERDAGYAAKTLMQHRQCPVLGTEIVAPLAHAMDLINRKQAQQTACMQRIE